MATPGRYRNGDGKRRQAASAVTCAIIGFDPLFLDILAAVLQLRLGLRAVVRTPSIRQGQKSCVAERPDLVILDLAGLGRPALAVVSSLLDVRSDARSVLLAASSRECDRPPWFRETQHAIVHRQETLDTLLMSIEQLFVGRFRATADRLYEKPIRRHRPLTDREAEVLALVNEGLTTREIAVQLARSPNTILTHRKRISEKIGRLGSRLARRVRRQAGIQGDGEQRRPPSGR